MADVTFNWRSAQDAAKQMQGYQPNVQPNYRGMAPSQAVQAGNAVASQQQYDAFAQGEAVLAQKRQRLAVLKAQLADIDNKIAGLQATGADDERAIAAKLAEIGDMSLYQGILARDQGAGTSSRAASDSIDNMLFDAEKLTWGLQSKNAEDRNMVRSNIGATLRRAEQQAAKAGVDLSTNDSYKRLKAAMDEGDKASIVYEGEEKFANTLWSKAQEGTLKDEDIVEAKKWIASHPDSQYTARVIQVTEQYAPKTAENKAKAAKRKAAARKLFDKMKDLPLDEALRQWNVMTDRDKKLLNDHGYKMDPKLGLVSEGGL